MRALQLVQDARFELHCDLCTAHTAASYQPTHRSVFGVVAYLHQLLLLHTCLARVPDSHAWKKKKKNIMIRAIFGISTCDLLKRGRQHKTENQENQEIRNKISLLRSQAIVSFQGNRRSFRNATQLTNASIIQLRHRMCEKSCNSFDHSESNQIAANQLLCCDSQPPKCRQLFQTTDHSWSTS